MWLARHFPPLFSSYSPCKSEPSLTVGLLPLIALFPSSAGRGVRGEGLSTRMPSPQPSPKGRGSVNAVNERVANKSTQITKRSPVATYGARVATCAARVLAWASRVEAYASRVRALRPRAQASVARVQAFADQVRTYARRYRAKRPRRSTSGIWVESRTTIISPHQGDDKSFHIDPWALPTAITFHAFSVNAKSGNPTAIRRRGHSVSPFLFISSSFRNHAFGVITSRSLLTFLTHLQGEER